MVEAALTADVDGHEAFNCAGPDNALGEPLGELFREYYGSIPEEFDAEGDASVYSTAKAAERLGWTPSHSWRDAAGESIPAPEV